MDEKRKFLVDCAIELFTRYGIVSVTMDEVAKATGMSKKTVYECFANKAALVETVVDQLITQCKNMIGPDMNISKDPVEELLLHQGLFRQLIALRNVFNEMMLKRYPRALIAVNKFKSKYLKAVVELNLLNGITKGLYRPELDIPGTATIYTSVADFYLFYNLKNRDEIFGAFRLFLNGIITNDGRRILANYNK